MRKVLSILFFVSVNFVLAQDANSRSQSQSTISNSSGTISATADGTSRSQTTSVFTQTNSTTTSGDNKTSKKSEAIIDPAEDKRTKNNSGKNPK